MVDETDKGLSPSNTICGAVPLQSTCSLLCASTENCSILSPNSNSYVCMHICAYRCPMTVYARKKKMIKAPNSRHQGTLVLTPLRCTSSDGPNVGLGNKILAIFIRSFLYSRWNVYGDIHVFFFRHQHSREKHVWWSRRITENVHLNMKLNINNSSNIFKLK